jgi:uncharacterized protein (DUF1778 family)
VARNEIGLALVTKANAWLPLAASTAGDGSSRRGDHPLHVLQVAIHLTKSPPMATKAAHARRSSSAANKTANLRVRVDRSSKQVIARAARIRGVSVSDYVRSVVVAQARREVEEAHIRTIVLTPDEQLTFWQALEQSAALSPPQRELGRVMRGER